MATTKIDLGKNVRGDIAVMLNNRLADAIDLSAQCKQAHWNVKGPHFIALHELFDQLYTNVVGYIDIVAERITALGETANGTIQSVAKTTSLPAYPGDLTTGGDHVDKLSDAFAAFAKAARKDIDTATEAGDAVTADVLTEVVRGLDKDLWFLDAHLGRKS
jgi:starvation-inducible DNA-binding protein